MNASRPVRHVLVLEDPQTGHRIIQCTHCFVSGWHCGWWVDATEMHKRLVEHSQSHKDCKP